MKKLLIFLALLIAHPALATYYLRTDCGTLLAPVEGDVCSQSTTVSGRTSGHLYIYRSSAWVDVDSGGGSGAPTTSTYITQTPDGSLSGEQAMSLLATGIVKNTTATGVQSIATPGSDYVAPTGSGAGLTSLNASNLGSGTVPTARLGSGTADATTFLKGNNTWGAPTVSALSANGANCSAGQAPLGVDASGAAEGCYDIATQVELDSHANLTTAHGAVSTNTASRIVLRDSSGNFSAGAITANLTGTVSGNASSASTLGSIGSGTVPLKGDGAGATAVATGADLSLPNYCADAGATDAYACSLPTNPGTYAAGHHFWFKANTANTGQATINFNTQGAGVIKKAVSAVTTDLVTGDICAGQIVEVIYDGTNFEMVSPLCQNPSVISGLTTGTVPKAASASTLTNSGISEDGVNTIITLPPKIGNCATDCLTLDPAAITGTKTLSYPNANDTFVGKATGDILTNKTIDAEGTGNIISMPVTKWLPAAGCNDITAGSIWDLPSTTPAVPACVTGTNTQKGVLDFADTSGGFSAQITEALPSDWTTTGGLGIKLYWTTTATTGNAKWSVSTACAAVAATATDDPAFNTANTVTTAAAGSASRVQTSAISSLTTTGCTTATAMLLHVKIFRDGDDAADTISATARFIGAELTYRRAM